MLTDHRKEQLKMLLSWPEIRAIPDIEVLTLHVCDTLFVGNPDEISEIQSYLESLLPPSVIPHLKAKDVVWVVNDLAELGVKLGNQFFWLYKGDSLVYDTGTHDTGRPMRWRKVKKREFGESCLPHGFDRLQHRRAPSGEVDYTDPAEEWTDLPADPMNA